MHQAETTLNTPQDVAHVMYFTRETILRFIRPRVEDRGVVWCRENIRALHGDTLLADIPMGGLRSIAAKLIADDARDEAASVDAPQSTLGAT